MSADFAFWLFIAAIVACGGAAAAPFIRALRVRPEKTSPPLPLTDLTDAEEYQARKILNHPSRLDPHPVKPAPDAFTKRLRDQARDFDAKQRSDRLQDQFNRALDDIHKMGERIDKLN